MDAVWWRQATPRSRSTGSCIKLTLAVTRKKSGSGREAMGRDDIAHRDAVKSNRRQLASKEGR